jgi:hypothetical protein
MIRRAAGWPILNLRKEGIEALGNLPAKTSFFTFHYYSWQIASSQ